MFFQFKTYYFLLKKMEFPYQQLFYLERFGNIDSIVTSYTDVELHDAFNEQKYNIVLRGKSVTDSLDGIFYMHQKLMSRYLIYNDSILLMHEPGTGKTVSYQNAAMILFISKLINKIVIVNTSSRMNDVAEKSLQKIFQYYSYKLGDLTFNNFKKEYVVFKTYASLHDLQISNYSLVIMDEGHNLLCESGTTKSMKCKNTNTLIDMLENRIGVKIILSTATPMINFANGFDDILKILTRNSEYTMKSSTNFDNIPFGSISYIDTNYDYLTIKQMYNDEDSEKGVYLTRENAGIDMKRYKVLPKNGQLAQIIERLVADENSAFLTNFEELVISSDSYTNNDISVKDHAIVDEMLKHINKMEDGIAIIYTSLKKNGSSAIATILQENGYKEYNPDTSLSDGKNYILYTAESTQKMDRALLQAKSPENWNGSKVKIIIGSRVMRDGVDISHALQIHIGIPEWNLPGTIQAWHRGIRSKGHEMIIYNRALKLMNEEKITFDEAKQKIIKNKIEVKIFNYFLDVQSVSESDIENASKHFKLNSVKKYSFAELKNFLDKSQHTDSHKFNIMKKKYLEVGPLMNTIRENAIDYDINVSKKKPECITGIVENRLIFSDELIDLALQKIIDIITDVMIIDTDVLIDKILLDERLTMEIVVDAIFYLVNIEKYIYCPKLSKKTNVFLYENLNESLLYIATDETDKHPRACFVNSVSANITTKLEKKLEEITEDDILEDPARDHCVVRKLKRILAKSVHGETLSDNELMYAKKMSNFWALKANDILRETDENTDGTIVKRKNVFPKGMTVYIFTKHIESVMIHIYTEKKEIMSYVEDKDKNYEIDTWVTIAPRDQFFVKSSILVSRYMNRNLDFLPKSKIDLVKDLNMKPFVKNGKTGNGVFMLKTMHNSKLNITPMYENENGKTYTRRIAESITDFILNDSILGNEKKEMKKKIVKKEYNVTGSIGSQNSELVSETLKNVIRNLEKGIYIFTAIYNDPTLLENEYDILDIKINEYNEIINAENGNPSDKFKIFEIEKKNISSDVKKELYSLIYSKK